MSNRRTTIHDLTSLALHPTGSRAQPHQTNALKDARGNWIAKDAGGWGAVPKRPGTTSVESDDDDDEQEGEDSEGGAKDKGKGKGKGKAKQLDEDSRARKRRKTSHDIDFLHNQISILTHHYPPDFEDDDTSAPEPSIPSSVRPYFSFHNSISAPPLNICTSLPMHHISI
jgi:hypothetical protein